MFDISVNFDSKKFERELQREVEVAALKEVKHKLRDLILKGLRVSLSRGSISLEGEEDLIEEAQKRLS